MTEDEKDMFELFEEQFADTETDVSDQATDFTKLSNLEISTMFNDVRNDLITMGEMLVVKTDAGRELHSQRTALLVEMAKRKMR